jgi:YD repeat-containing protein
VSPAQILPRVVFVNDKVSTLYRLTYDDLRQRIAERVIAGNTGNKGSKWVWKCAFGPFDKLEKVEQVSGFDLISRESLLRQNWGAEENEEQQAGHEF